MAGQVGNSDGDVGFQIAPMVDVVFVLVLFFMSSAGMQQAELELGVNLPSGGAAGPDAAVVTPVFVEISNRGQVSVNGQNFDTPESKELPSLTAHLQALMASGGGKDPVIVRPDMNAPHHKVVDVLNAAAKAQVKTLTFS